MDSRDTPREPFARFHATLATVRAEQARHNWLMDSLVVQEGRAIVIERVNELRAWEFYEGEATR